MGPVSKILGGLGPRPGFTPLLTALGLRWSTISKQTLQSHSTAVLSVSNNINQKNQ